MKQARDEHTFAQSEPAPKNQHIASKAYANTTIDGSASVVQGDNHGSVTNQYGDHHYYLPPRRGAESDIGKSRDDKSTKLLASLTFEDMGTRLRNVSPALSTTCQWLRNHRSFVSWLSDDRFPEPYGLLWIKGKPGSGKSTIMRETLLWVTRELPQQLVIAYFFDARSPHRLAKSTLGMYRYLLYQLVSVRGEICEIFVKEFSSKIGDSKSENWAETEIDNWSETEIQNFLISLADTQKLSALAIFIDALDEDDGDDVQQMVAFFEDLQRRVISRNGTLRICLSSRHYPHITVKGDPIILEEQPGHKGDISEYVRTRLLGKKSRGKSELQEKIIRKAAGIFLWVILMIHVLNQEFNCGRGLASMYRELDRAPEEVQDLFRAILAREEKNEKECRTLLRWVLFAERLLSPMELCAALRQISPEDLEQKSGLDDNDNDDDEEESRYLLYCSRGLVELTKATPPTVQFVHETVRELLMNISLDNHVSTSPTATPPKPVAQPQICHAMIAEFCLVYLSNVSTRMRPIELLRYPLLDYAAEHWWRHLEKTNGSYRTTLLRLASTFLTDPANQIFWGQLCWGNLNDYTKLIRRSIGEYFHQSPDQSLCRAALANIPELVRELVSAGADINFGRETMTVLVLAVAIRNTKMVKILLELGADPNVMQQFSALGLATQMQDMELIRVLLEAGAAVDFIDHNYTPLGTAARLGRGDIVNLLLDWGADINLEGRYGSPLALAAKFGRKDVVKIFIERGADVELGDVSYSPLSLAVARGHGRIVKLLLDCRSPIEYGGGGCEILLEMAKRLGREEIVKMLLARGAGGKLSDPRISDSHDCDLENMHRIEDSSSVYNRSMALTT